MSETPARYGTPVRTLTDGDLTARYTLTEGRMALDEPGAAIGDISKADAGAARVHGHHSQPLFSLFRELWNLYSVGMWPGRTIGALLASLVLAHAALAASNVCPGDVNDDGTVTIDEIITSVNNSLLGCPTPGTRFVDNRDGTISDNQTGLMWEKKTESDGVANSANLHDADNTFNWAGTCSPNVFKYCQPNDIATSHCAAYVEIFTTACGPCVGLDGTCNVTETVWTWIATLNQTNFAGHSDWRLPKIGELQSLADYTDGGPPAINAAFDGIGCGASCTDITDPACSCTRPFYTWSASPSASSFGQLWFVNF